VSGDSARAPIVVGKQEERAFSASDINLITTVAASLSVALQNAQSFESERQRVAELAIINERPGGARREARHPGRVTTPWATRSASALPAARR
jgi:GAF domain-containing protein